jgi:hypothetical protein
LCRENENFIEPAVKPLQNPSEVNILDAHAEIDRLRVPPREFLDCYVQTEFFNCETSVVSKALKSVLHHYEKKRALHPSAFSVTFLKKLLDQKSPRAFESAFEDLTCFEFHDYSGLFVEALRMVDRKPDDERYHLVASLCLCAQTGAMHFGDEEVITFAF